MFKTIQNFYKTTKIINDECKNNELLDKLSATFDLKFKKDKIGRIYSVINPIIKNINNNGNTLIFTSTTEDAISQFLLRNLNMLTKFVGDNYLLDVLTYKIDKIDDDDNYLIVLESIYLKPTIKIFKTILYILLSLILVISLIFIII